MTTTTITLPNGMIATTENILRVWRAATECERAEGMRWYEDAHNVASDFARGRVSIETACGVIAALSPRMRWGRNVMLAERCIREGMLIGGCLGASIRSANRIMNGEDALTVLSGSKVRAFYATVLDPSISDAVVIDAHALSIAVGRALTNAEQKIMKRAGVYDMISGLYREAAEILGVLPSQVQAVTWVAWRNLPAADKR